MSKWSKVAQFSANALVLALTANTAVQLDILREIAMRSRVLVDSVGFDYGIRCVDEVPRVGDMLQVLPFD